MSDPVKHEITHLLDYSSGETLVGDIYRSVQCCSPFTRGIFVLFRRIHVDRVFRLSVRSFSSWEYIVLYIKYLPPLSRRFINISTHTEQWSPNFRVRGTTPDNSGYPRVWASGTLPLQRENLGKKNLRDTYLHGPGLLRRLSRPTQAPE